MAGQSPFAVRSLGGLPVVTAPAEIDIGNASQLGAALMAAANGHPTIVADMAPYRRWIDPLLALLLKRDGAAVTGVDKVFRIFDSLPEAVADAT